MPTTRFASTTKTVESPVQSQQQLRETRFLAKKTLDLPSETNSDLQKLLVEFLQVLLVVDKQHLLFSQVDNEEEQQQLEFETIEDRVYKDQYQSISHFKRDLDELFKNVLSTLSSSRQETNAFTQLYQFYTHRLKFEAKRLNQEIENTDDVYRLTALFRPTIDGYAFTDFSLKTKDAKPITDLPFNVQEIEIHPYVSSVQNEVPSLKHTVAPPPKYLAKTIKHENKPVVPIQWLDFGAFSSFAPASDSNNANASYEGTYMGRSAKRFKRWEKKHLNKDNHVQDDALANKQANTEWLVKEGFDVDALEAALEKEPDSVSEELERNSELLNELVKYQEQRFVSGGNETKWSEVGEKEREIAEALQKNMADMLSRLPPNATKESSALIEKAMERIPLLEPAYRGTLPPHKIFSFPTTEKAEPLPPYANITPTYSKDHWRLVKVASIPKEGTHSNSNNVNSMIEQQHMNFYSKPSTQSFNTPTPPHHSMPPQAMPNLYQQRK
ncbi:hypothetical protein K501DRAFT_260577 [Backusella circina FSU 941]|nr:hypothetical protein K501DRAFT_234252 [Backusella circina FSU 941]KAI8877337.1 hypothetical protein K501DRAFT_260577 [Backusella circina FSU 941]